MDKTETRTKNVSFNFEGKKTECLSNQENNIEHDFYVKQRQSSITSFDTERTWLLESNFDWVFGSARIASWSRRIICSLISYQKSTILLTTLANLFLSPSVYLFAKEVVPNRLPASSTLIWIIWMKITFNRTQIMENDWVAFIVYANVTRNNTMKKRTPIFRMQSFRCRHLKIQQVQNNLQFFFLFGNQWNKRQSSETSKRTNEINKFEKEKNTVIIGF